MTYRKGLSPSFQNQHEAIFLHALYLHLLHTHKSALLPTFPVSFSISTQLKNIFQIFELFVLIYMYLVVESTQIETSFSTLVYYCFANLVTALSHATIDKDPRTWLPLHPARGAQYTVHSLSSLSPISPVSRARSLRNVPGLSPSWQGCSRSIRLEHPPAECLLRVHPES